MRQELKGVANNIPTGGRESDSKKERQQGTVRDKQIERKTEGERKSLNIYFDFVIR